MFSDIRPAAAEHFLVVPKKHMSGLFWHFYSRRRTLTGSITVNIQALKKDDVGIGMEAASDSSTICTK
jgi:hypothetical protein